MTQNKSERASCPAWCTSSHTATATDTHSKSFGNFIKVWTTFDGGRVAKSGVLVEIEEMETESDLLALLGQDWNRAVDWRQDVLTPRHS